VTLLSFSMKASALIDRMQDRRREECWFAPARVGLKISG
jgi:hypothetical protein